MSQQDIAVVGAGPVGMTLALVLAQSGYKVSLLEKQSGAQSNDTDARRLTLSWGSLQLLKSIDLEEQLLESGELINNIAVRQAGSLISGRFHATQHQPDYFALAIGFSDLTAMLQQAINQSDSIQMFRPFSPDSLRLTETSIVLSHNEQQIEAHLAIAVDGTDSQMLRLLGINSMRHEYGQMASMVKIILDDSLNGTACEVFAGDYTFILIPNEGKQATLIQIAPMHAAIRPKQLLNKAFIGMAPKIMTMELAGSFPLTGTYAEEILRPRCLVLGNAARTMHPLLAQGLNLAYAQTSILIKTLATHKDPGNWQLLRSYQKQAYPLGYRTAFAVNGIRRLVGTNLPASPVFGLMNMLYPIRDKVVHLASGYHQWNTKNQSL